MGLLVNLMERISKRKISSIRTLHFHSRTQLLGHHFLRLANLGLKLISLRLNLLYDSSLKSLNYVAEGWMKFLESQSETLEELLVECHKWKQCPELTFGFPRLRKLKRLTIGPVNTIKFSGICYTKQFPSLEQLSLNSNCDNVSEAFLNSDLPPVETVDILELPGLNDPVWYRHAARIFPNVKKLKIRGRKEITRVVFQGVWKNVEDLTIKGMCPGGSANQLLAVNFEGDLPLNYRLGTSGMPAKFLQDLKTLRLEGFSGGGFLPTTRICQLVLLKMGSLKCLDLSKCRNPESMISASMLSTMRKQFVVLC